MSVSAWGRRNYKLNFNSRNFKDIKTELDRIQKTFNKREMHMDDIDISLNITYHDIYDKDTKIS